MSLEKNWAKPKANSAANRAEPLARTAARKGAFAQPGQSHETAANMANSSLSHSRSAAASAVSPAGAASAPPAQPPAWSFLKRSRNWSVWPANRAI